MAVCALYIKTHLVALLVVILLKLADPLEIAIEFGLQTLMRSEDT